MDRKPILGIDIGNTLIRFGLINENEVLGSFQITTRLPRTRDEFGMCIRSLLEESIIDSSGVEGAVLSCVVPDRAQTMKEAVVKYLGTEPLVVGPGVKTGIKIRTENPREIGADRIVNIAAAHALYGRNTIVVDFGTATVFDHVFADGTFSYTVIMPGLEICADALKSSTAKLPGVELAKTSRILMRNTVECTQAGLIYGYIGSLEKILSEMKKELKDPECLVVATGDLGRMFTEETDLFDRYEPDLAFYGMKVIYDLTAASAK